MNPQMNWENDFELPPAKKLRSEFLSSTDLASPHDRMDDGDDDADNDALYGIPRLKTERTLNNSVQTISTTESSKDTKVVKASFSLPGLGLVVDGLEGPLKRIPTAHSTAEYHNATILNVGYPNNDTAHRNTSQHSDVSSRSRAQSANKCECDDGTLSIENEGAECRDDRIVRDGTLRDKAIKGPRFADDQQSPLTSMALAHVVGEEPSSLGKADDQASIGTTTDRSYLPVVALEAHKDVKNVQDHPSGDQCTASNERSIAASYDEAGRVVCSPSTFSDCPTKAQHAGNEASETSGGMNGNAETHRLLATQDSKCHDKPENCDAGNIAGAIKDVSGDIGDQNGLDGSDSVAKMGPRSQHILQYNHSSNNEPVTSSAHMNTLTHWVTNTEAEVEVDSSPYESSSEDSTDSSEDESDNDYKMLEPAAQARLLMQEDGGSEDEAGTRGSCIGPLRTLNEKLDENVEIPDVIVTADMEIQELGPVETFVDNIVLVRAKTSGEYQVLEAGSVLCLADRTVIGVVAETLGRVQQPLYSVRFPSSSSIIENGIMRETTIFYVPQHSTYVFTQALKAVRGSDASNLHDEEVGDDELEFSDDEAEAEYKRRQKLQRQAKRAGRGASGGGLSYGSRPRDFKSKSQNKSVRPGDKNNAVISYDDAEDADELYTPLTRPAHLHEMMRQGQESSQALGEDYRGAHHRRNTRGDYGRGREGHRQTGTGDRGGSHHRGRQRGNADMGHIQNSDLPSVYLSLIPNSASSSSVLNSDPSASGATLRPFPAHVYQSHSTPHDQSPSVGQSQGQFQYTYAPGRLPVRPELLVGYDPPVQGDCFPRLHYEHHQHLPQAQHAIQQPMSLHPGSVLPPGAFVNPAFFRNHYLQAHNQNLPNSQYIVTEQPAGSGPWAAPE